MVTSSAPAGRVAFASFFLQKFADFVYLFQVFPLTVFYLQSSQGTQKRRDTCWNFNSMASKTAVNVVAFLGLGKTLPSTLQLHVCGLFARKWIFFCVHVCFNRTHGLSNGITSAQSCRNGTSLILVRFHTVRQMWSWSSQPLTIRIHHTTCTIKVQKNTRCCNMCNQTRQKKKLSISEMPGCLMKVK